MCISLPTGAHGVIDMYLCDLARRTVTCVHYRMWATAEMEFNGPLQAVEFVT